MKPEIIVFDLNGTLLDLAALDGHFTRIFGSPSFREKWFEQLQILWMTTIADGTYQPFEKLARAALEMLVARESVHLSSADENEERAGLRAGWLALELVESLLPERLRTFESLEKLDARLPSTEPFNFAAE